MNHIKCPYCDRPYLRVSRNGKMRIRITHAAGCQITTPEDKGLRRQARNA